MLKIINHHSLLSLDWDITKKRFSNVEWARCCVPIDEGGFGIHSIRFANASFICKLAWDTLTASDDFSRLLQDR